VENTYLDYIQIATKDIGLIYDAIIEISYAFRQLLCNA